MLNETLLTDLTPVDNDIIVSLRHVQWMRLYYINQHGQEVSKRPDKPTYRLKSMPKDELIFGTNVSLYERAEKMGVLDVWTPILYVSLSANSRLRYKGDKALSLWKAWQAKQFSKKKKL